MTTGQAWQDILRVALDRLGIDVNTTQDVIFQKIAQALESPLRLYATEPTADAILTIGPSTVEDANGAGKSSAPLKAVVGDFPVSTINFQTGATTGGTINLTLPASTVGLFRRIGFSYVPVDNEVTATVSDEAASVAALANAGELMLKNGSPVGWIDLECTNAGGEFKTAASATLIIENKVGSDIRIFNFGSGSGGGGGGGVFSKSYLVTFTAESTKDIDVGSDNINSEKSLVQILDTGADYKDLTGSFDVTRPDGDTLRLTTGIAITGTYRVVVFEVLVGELSSFFDITMNGIELFKVTDITSSDLNAQKSSIQVLDAANDYKDITSGMDIKRPLTTSIRIDTGVPLPAGTYRLVVKEVE